MNFELEEIGGFPNMSYEDTWLRRCFAIMKVRGIECIILCWFLAVYNSYIMIWMDLFISNSFSNLCPELTLDVSRRSGQRGNIQENVYFISIPLDHESVSDTMFQKSLVWDYERRHTPIDLVSIARAYPSSPISNDKRVHLPSSLNLASAGHVPIGSLKIFSVILVKPAASISFLMVSAMLKGWPVISPASLKSYCTLERLCDRNPKHCLDK